MAEWMAERSLWVSKVDERSCSVVVVSESELEADSDRRGDGERRRVGGSDDRNDDEGGWFSLSLETEVMLPRPMRLLGLPLPLRLLRLAMRVADGGVSCWLVARGREMLRSGVDFLSPAPLSEADRAGGVRCSASDDEL